MKSIRRFVVPLLFFVCAFFLLSYLSGIYRWEGEKADISDKEEEHRYEESIKVNVEEYISALCASGDGVISDGVYNSEEYFFSRVNSDIFAKKDSILDTRMGYILADTPTQSLLLSYDGGVLFDNTSGALSLIGERNAEGLPVFELDGEYYIINSAGALEKTVYDERTMSKGVKFDYPSYYGISDEPDISVSSNKKYFGYLKGDEVICDLKYEKAFAYSEGFGCTYDKEGRLYFHNEEGRVRIAGLNDIMYGSTEADDERALGFYYFDEGLCRAVRKTFKKGELVNERQIIINRYGDEMILPSDYTLYSYSDGMMLMQKDGRSGYMNSRGAWVTEPTYTYARPFFEGLAVVGNADGNVGVIDKNGEYVIAPVFDKITDCSGGVMALFDDEYGWYVIKKCKK